MSARWPASIENSSLYANLIAIQQFCQMLLVALYLQIHLLLATSSRWHDRRLSARVSNVGETARAVPLIRAGVTIGTINIRRTAVRLFSDRQFALLATFASRQFGARSEVEVLLDAYSENGWVAERLKPHTK